MKDKISEVGKTVMNFQDFVNGSQKMRANEALVKTLVRLEIVDEVSSWMLIDGYWPEDYMAITYMGDEDDE